MVGVTFFRLRCMFLVPSLKNTAPIFLEIFLIECCTVLMEPPMTLLLKKRHHFPHLHNTKNISKKKKRYSQKEYAILFYFEKPLK